MSTIPHYTDYRCTGCGKKTEKMLLTAKKVMFSAIGAGAKLIRSRTTEWLCNECLPNDPDWNKPAFTSAPGLKSPALERVREAQARTDGVVEEGK